jgi:hypothetical protein
MKIFKNNLVKNKLYNIFARYSHSDPATILRTEITDKIYPKKKKYIKKEITEEMIGI